MEKTRLQKAVDKMVAKSAKGSVQPVEKVYLNMKEAMAYLGCERDFLTNLRDEGVIRCSKIGKLLWFWKTDIDKMMRENVMKFM